MLACASSAMPISGRKADVIASWLVSSRHCVFHTIAAFRMTLAVPTNTATTGHGDGACGVGAGQGTKAKAVSMVRYSVKPHIVNALTGMIDGVQNAKLAVARTRGIG